MSTRSPVLPALLFSFSLALGTLAPAEVRSQALCGACPPCISLVGTNGVVADPAGNFCIRVCGPTGAPLPGIPVVVDFSGCPGISLCATQPDPLMVVLCATRSVMKPTDAAGQVCFSIVGGATVVPGVPCPPPGCATISAAGVVLCTTSVTAYDLDNVGGVGASDLSIWLSLFFGGGPCLIGDYDCNGVLSPADLSQWLAVYFAAGSSVGCPSPKCP
jgi:hypothetical protein